MIIDFTAWSQSTEFISDRSTAFKVKQCGDLDLLQRDVSLLCGGLGVRCSLGPCERGEDQLMKHACGDVILWWALCVVNWLWSAALPPRVPSHRSGSCPAAYLRLILRPSYLLQCSSSSSRFLSSALSFYPSPFLSLFSLFLLSSRSLTLRPCPLPPRSLQSIWHP